MKITLVFDIVKGHDEGSDYIALRALFTCRLFSFLFANTEVSFFFFISSQLLTHNSGREDILQFGVYSVPLD